MKYNKAKIVIIAKDKEEAISFYQKIMGDANTECDRTTSNLIYEHPIYRVVYKQEYSVCCGERCQFIYAKEHIINSEWFKTVVRPMVYMGVEKIQKEL